MALSEQEQRLLDEMERSLYQHDADVVSTGRPAGAALTARSITISVLALAVGLAVIVGAMAIQQPWAGLIGFAIMIGGVYWAFASSGSSSTGESTKLPGTPGRPTTDAGVKSPDGRGFMDRMEDRWDRRQDNQG
ncbi:DUF3040 domain-containing protein [Gulosibacter sediminis]|uniref:DUF3040 domain-containing protein n=1 Tax=Gulosibacter sediminis TaxID=1729695 RepID=UPI0024A87455|nr:DUF3040 domain-containing protein [Gulosibacter sediminis]